MKRIAVVECFFCVRRRIASEFSAGGRLCGSQSPVRGSRHGKASQRTILKSDLLIRQSRHMVWEMVFQAFVDFLLSADKIAGRKRQKRWRLPFFSLWDVHADSDF